MRTRLCVGNESDPAEVRKALHGLRMMARLGCRAQRALDALERDGKFPHAVALLERDEYGGCGLEALRVKAASGIFPARGVTRDTLPGWEDLKLEFGPLDEEERPNKQTYRFFSVYLVGKGFAYDNQCEENGVVQDIVFGDITFGIGHYGPGEIGQARLKQGGSVSFSPNDEGKVLKVYRDVTSSDRARDSAGRFAKAVANRLVRTDHHGFERHHVPQWLLDLRRAVPGWLLEDFVQDWFEQILLWAKNVRIVSEVMES